MEILIDANFKLTGIFEPPWCLSLDKDKITLRELLKHLDSLWETVHILEGEDLSDDYLMELGGMVMQIERKFNEAAGFSKKDDRLPDFFYEEKLEPSGGVFDVPQEEINAVYQ